MHQRISMSHRSNCRYAQIHEEKLRALKEQFVWIDTLPSSSGIEQQKPLPDDDFVAIYNKRMTAIKDRFRDQLGTTFASSSTPIDPQVYAQHLTQMRQQCGLVATPITTGQVSIVLFDFVLINRHSFFFSRMPSMPKYVIESKEDLLLSF